MLFRVNAQSEVYEQALAERGRALRAARRRAVLRPRRRSGEARLLLRGAARAESSGRAASSTRCAMCWPARLDPRGATGRGRRPRALGVTGGARHSRRGPAGDPARRGPGRIGQRTGSARFGPARADRAGRDAGVAALGQGPGVGRGLPGRPHRHDPADPARHHAGPDRRGATAALRRDHPGAGAAGVVLGAGSFSPGSAGAVGPVVSWTAYAPARRGRAARRRSQPGHRSPMRRPPPTSNCLPACARGAASRRTRRAFPPTWCSQTRHSSESLIPELIPEPGSGASQVWARPSWSDTRNRCWRFWPVRIRTRWTSPDAD